MKRWISSLFKIAGMLFLLLVLLFCLLQTTPGKEILASYLSKTMGQSENLDVHIGRIRGWIPAHMQIDDLQVGDAQGIWLTATNLESLWVLGDLLKGTIRFRKLEVGQIELLRFPASAKAAPPRQRDLRGLEKMDVVLEGWSVDRLTLGPKVAGLPLEYMVRSGGIVLREGRLSGDLEIAGDAVGRVKLQAGFGGASEYRMTIGAELDHMTKPAFGMDRLSGTGEMAIDAEGVTARVTVEVERRGLAGRFASKLHYAGRTLQVEGFRFDSEACTAQGDLSLGFSKALIDFNIDASLHAGERYDFVIQGDAAIATSNKAWMVMIPALSVRAWDSASISVTGSFGPDSVDLAAALAEFDLADMPVPSAKHFAGRAGGTLSVTGTPMNPKVNAELSLVRVASSSTSLDELPGLDVHIAGGLSNGAVFVKTSITNFVGGYLTADAAMPCAFSMIPFIFEADANRLHGSLDAILDLDIFNGLAMLENQGLKGRIAAELEVHDRVPSGCVMVENGAYEHYEWGILFRDCNALLNATEEGLVIKTASATDGRGGRLDLSGSIGRNHLNVILDLSKANVIRRPEVEAMISGRLTLAGNASHPEVTGYLMVDRAELLPDNIVSASPALLGNYDASAHALEETSAITKHRFPIGMDIRMDMQDQVSVNASLIDSVWGGSIRIRNDVGGLSLIGKIQPRRGYVDFIGKKFRLRDGSIDINSASHSMPVMNNLTAEYSRSDITARLILNGSVNNPQYLLESTPALPKDEILSQILFRRDASTISAYQAVQIASAAQQLSGGLNGPGFMYQFRQAVGVDTLEWREPDTADGSSSVAAGKYITPELYVEVSSTFGAEAQTDMTAEYEIGRHFSVETSAGPKLRPGIGVNWRYDY